MNKELKIKIICDPKTNIWRMEGMAIRRIQAFSKTLKLPFKRIVLKEMSSSEWLDDNKILATYVFEVE